MNLGQRGLLWGLRAYQVIVSPALTALFGPMGLGCRFQPTCSTYAMEAVRRHGAWRGAGLALRRLFRCHPWGGSGDDPVPPASAHPPTSRPKAGSSQLSTLPHGS